MKRIHLIGIGGSGVSALAGILKKLGHIVSGSDNEENSLTEKLKRDGIKIYIGHDKKNIMPDIDVVIHSLAIPLSNSELTQARKKGIKILSYPEAVGQLTKQYFTIAVCGTHGKSTITSLIAKILIENIFDLTVIVGTKVKELDNTNFRVGKSKILVLEACEYCRAFLNYNPRIIVLHTLDPDHLDYYKSFTNYLNAFRQFANKLPADGYFFANLDDEDVHDILQYLQSKKFAPYNLFTYSTKYSYADFFLKENQIFHKSVGLGELNLKVPGAHNRTNALAAFVVCSMLGIAPKNILKSLNRYEGAHRRFEIKGKIGKTILIDDYAHHPEEIKATLQAAREKFPRKKICVVFQPHQYSRTKNLLEEFSTAFKGANCVIVPNIYEVRDTKKDKKSISPEIFVSRIRKSNKNVFYGQGIKNTVNWLDKNAKKFDVIFTMGAGDVWKIGDSLLKS